MSIEISDIFLDPFYSNTLTQYGGDTVPLDALVWQRFVGLYDLDVTRPLTDTQKLAYKAYLTRYRAWGLTIDDLSSTAVQPSSANYVQCYEFANTLFPNISAVEIKDIWNGFLREYSLDSRQVEGQDLSALFTNYLKLLVERGIAYDSLPDNQRPTPKSPEQVYQIALWNRFLEVFGYSARDASTQDERVLFSKFVQQYANWRMDLATLQSTNPLPSGDGADFFLSYINAFYGNLSTIEQTDLWNRFLTLKGLTSNPADLSPLRQPFADFINSLQSQKAAFERVTALSPHEIEQRTVFNDVMTSLQKMLIASEGVVTTNAAAMRIYSEWQKMYTEQMTRAPNLVAVPKTTETRQTPTGTQTIQGQATSRETTLQIPPDADISTWDLSKYTFGYGKISLKDVITWAADSLMKDPSTPITFGDEKSPMGAYIFSVEQGPSGARIKVSFDIYLKDPLYANDVLYPRTVTPEEAAGGAVPYGPDDRPDLYTEVTQSAFLPMLDSQGNPLSKADSPGTPYDLDDWVSAISDTFKEVFTALSIQTPYPTDPTYNVIKNLRGAPDDPAAPYYPAGIPGRFLEDMEAWTDPLTGQMMTDTTELQNRTAQNIVIQQYVNVTRSRREMVQNITANIQAVLQMAKDSVNKITSLWTSILEAITSITAAIFKR